GSCTRVWPSGIRISKSVASWTSWKGVQPVDGSGSPQLNCSYLQFSGNSRKQIPPALQGTKSPRYPAGCATARQSRDSNLAPLAQARTPNRSEFFVSRRRLTGIMAGFDASLGIETAKCHHVHEERKYAGGGSHSRQTRGGSVV